MNQFDRPFWSAMSTAQRHFSSGNERARRFDPTVGPSAACPDDEPGSLDALANLILPGVVAVLLQKGTPPVPPGYRVERVAAGVQMIARDATKFVEPGETDMLGSDDAADMLHLATLTKPGPFSTRTHELGQFFGIRIDGRLAAMAGERTRFDGATEVSAVCTHPEFRARGLAARLVSKVADEILKRGEQPYLHAFDSNTSAIRLYEQLGFEIRTPMTVTGLVRP